MRNPLSEVFYGAECLNSAVKGTGVIGIGSAHGDDQIGWYLIDQLEQRGVAETIQFEKVIAPAVSLLNSLQRYEKVILIDAGEIGLEAGEFSVIYDGRALLSDECNTADVQISSHHIGVTETWALAKQLGLTMPQVSLFVIQIQQTETMAPISASILDRLPELLQGFERLLSEVEVVT